MASYSADKLLEHYQFIGAAPDDGVLAKSLELCISYKISEEDLVESWAAFAISHLKSAPPTLSGLELLERRDLVKNNGGAADDGRSTASKRSSNKAASGPRASSTLPQPTQKPPSAGPESQPASAEEAHSQIPSYADRRNAGTVALANGTPEYSRCMSATSVKIHSGVPAPKAHERLAWRAAAKLPDVLADIMFTVATAIADKHGLVLPHVWDRKAAEMTLFGMIMPTSGKRLTKQNVGLELPSTFFANGEVITLNLAQIPAYALFPGQVAVVQGKFEKDEFKVAQLFTDGFAPPAKQIDLASLHIIAAFGPFTFKDNLLYEPLQDLLRVVVKERPHVLILGGPFVDEEHASVAAMTQDVDAHFEALIESILAPLEGCDTQVVLVASHRDAHHLAVFPTPPFQLAGHVARLVCAPDPCVLDVAGLHVAVSTVDALFPIGRNEVVHPPGALDRMARLSNHVLCQRSFYPIQADEVRELPFDAAFMEQYGMMECVPHIFVAPSNFRYFIKEISGCTVVNPAKLVKQAHVGGTYCQMQVSRNPEVKVTAQVINI